LGIKENIWNPLGFIGGWKTEALVSPGHEIGTGVHAQFGSLVGPGQDPLVVHPGRIAIALPIEVKLATCINQIARMSIDNISLGVNTGHIVVEGDCSSLAVSKDEEEAHHKRGGHPQGDLQACHDA
jgi:hypothetical protein